MKNENKKHDNENKLPFAVFVCSNANNDAEDYKQVFTEIISDRIQEKFK